MGHSICTVLLVLISVYQSQACYLIILPICGTDGVTYQNECFMKSAQGANPNLTKAHDGACDKADTSDNEEGCFCTLQYDPVCGTDGRTYGNSCALGCQAKITPGLREAFKGECYKTPVDPGCFCPMMLYAPVCGSDGRTYGNTCLLGCQARLTPGLVIAYKGECEKTSTDTPACGCTKEYLPVCGTDGRTYGNICTFNCQKKSDQDLEMAYRGECRQAVKVIHELARSVVLPPCQCTKEYIPVCGTDGWTYGTLCMLNCQKQINPDLEMAYEGECQRAGKVYYNHKLARSAVLPDCFCTREYLPLCGTDGRTYGNMCELDCQKQIDPDLKVAYGGKCQQGSAADACVCTGNWSPVCGTDGVTYGNICQLNCQKKINPDLEQASVGECLKQSRSLPCDCPGYKSFVCGSDGRTYDNMCFLQCHQTYESGLKKAGDGSC